MPEPHAEIEPIRSVTASSLSRRLGGAGFSAEVMAYHAGGKVLSGRAFVGHHGHDREQIRQWLMVRGLAVSDFGAGTFDVCLSNTVCRGTCGQHSPARPVDRIYRPEGSSS